MHLSLKNLKNETFVVAGVVPIVAIFDVVALQYDYTPVFYPTLFTIQGAKLLTLVVTVFMLITQLL